IELFIEDDGQGIDNLHNHSESLGIIGMRERARTANGTFLLDSASGPAPQMVPSCWTAPARKVPK
ncbi:hypothetical protein KBF38_02065, partial [bacterium]|nr:hypothetical protein [bacterium]